MFGIGLNYRAHAPRRARGAPHPGHVHQVPQYLTGPYDQVRLPSGYVGWEVELVVVVGRYHEVTAADAWAHVAGLTVGQDLSERVVRRAAGGSTASASRTRASGPRGRG